MEQDSAADGASSSELPSQSLFRKCINCGLESLPTGEKYPILNLCNACGLYYKYNGLTRSSDKINYRETFVPNWLGTNNGSIGTPSGTSSSELVILLAISNKNNEEIEIIIKNFDEFMHLCNNHGHECCLQTDKGQKAFRLLASEAPTRKFFIELDALILKKKTENGGIEMKLDEMKQRMIDMESIWEQQFSEEMEALKISSGEQSSKSMLYASTDEDKEKFDFICKHLTEFRELCSKNNCNCTAQMENTSITIRLVPTSTKTLEEIVEELDRFVGISQIKEELTEFVQEKEFWEDWRKGVQKIQAEKQKHPSTDRVAPIEPVNHIRFEQIHPICVTKVPHMEDFLQEKNLLITKFNTAIYAKFFQPIANKKYSFETYAMCDQAYYVKQYLSFLQTNTQSPNNIQLEMADKLSGNYRDGLEELKKMKNMRINNTNKRARDILSTGHFVKFVRDGEEMHMCLAICEKRIITWHVGRSKEEALDQLQADYQYVLDLSPFSSVGEKDYDDVYKENKRVIEWMKNNFLCINVPSHGLFVNSIPAIYNICHAHFTNLVK